VRVRALGSASVVYMNGSNLTLRLPQAGHTSVDLYCPCARRAHGSCDGALQAPWPS